MRRHTPGEGRPMTRPSDAQPATAARLEFLNVGLPTNVLAPRMRLRKASVAVCNSGRLAYGPLFGNSNLKTACARSNKICLAVQSGAAAIRNGGSNTRNTVSARPCDLRAL